MVKTGYRTKAYQDVIPDNCTITVTNDRLSILNSERSKKKKTNTPKSTDDLYKQDEIGHQSKKSLSEMLDQMEIARESEDDDDSIDL
jgi:membrane-associated HD superfamily phosphohydrolase